MSWFLLGSGEKGPSQERVQHASQYRVRWLTEVEFTFRHNFPDDGGIDRPLQTRLGLPLARHAAMKVIQTQAGNPISKIPISWHSWPDLISSFIRKLSLPKSIFWFIWKSDVYLFRWRSPIRQKFSTSPLVSEIFLYTVFFSIDLPVSLNLGLLFSSENRLGSFWKSNYKKCRSLTVRTKNQQKLSFIKQTKKQQKVRT